MNERARILQMVADGKIGVDQAEKLLDAAAGPGPAREKTADQTSPPEFLFVKVAGNGKDTVDIKVPLSLIRAGMRLTSLIPKDAMNEINRSMSEQGLSFDVNNLKGEDVETLIESLTKMEININSESGETIKVYCAA